MISWLRQAVAGFVAHQGFFLAAGLSFFFLICERGRSKLVEPVNDPETRMDEALVALASVEKAEEGGEGHPLSRVARII